jgi:glycosyltransferase involved in cell wall biosynthesis
MWYRARGLSENVVNLQNEILNRKIAKINRKRPPAPKPQPAPVSAPAPKPKPATPAPPPPKAYVPTDNPESLHFKRGHYLGLCVELLDYDIVSFDIFDTLILRKVESPHDVFSLMAYEMDAPEFRGIRVLAEQTARNRKEEYYNTREIVIEDIYNVLESQYSIDKKWMEREIELELELCVANPYMKMVYDTIRQNKRDIFIMSDMYLPRSTVEAILSRNGFGIYNHLFLSNQLGLRKGDGSMQLYVSENYCDGKKLIHIGDNYEADVRKSRDRKMAAHHYLPVRDLATPFRENHLFNLCGFFYRGLINNELHNGLWEENKYYEHGFKVAGLMACGYSLFINKLVKEHNISKVLFCARDCDVIHKVYNNHYNMVENDYISVSRLALLAITSERFLHDFIERIVKKVTDSVSVKTYGEALVALGFDYLIPFIHEYGLSDFDPCGKEGHGAISSLIMDHSALIKKQNEPQIRAAKQYFANLIEGHQNILIVDIGWSGSCIRLLKYFIETNFPERDFNIFGALMFTNDTVMLRSSLQQGNIYPYIASPYLNRDIFNTQLKNSNRNNRFFEYLFTSPNPSLIAYGLNEDGALDFLYSDIEYNHYDHIKDIHKGILDFADKFNSQYIGKWNKDIYIGPYAAATAYFKTLDFGHYMDELFADFTDDFIQTKSFKPSSAMADQNDDVRPLNHIAVRKTQRTERILMISHAMQYNGAPHSLLRVCKIIQGLGFSVDVWSSIDGDFTKEFEQIGIIVEIVPQRALDDPKDIANRVSQYSMAIINTIYLDRYADVIGRVIPAAWFIREATEIPRAVEGDFGRFITFSNYPNLYCVSDYAKDFISIYNPHVRVLNNCVEDHFTETETVADGADGKVKFLILGTFEHRKGQDIIFDAFERMPEAYQKQAEVYVAGACRTGSFFRDYWFKQMERVKNNPNFIYLGEIKNIPDKIKTISEMSVMVVASRHEACSLAALEAAMMAKPLIVTTSVGAKYMVSEENGLIVENDDPESMKNAFMYMIDNKHMLKSMGDASRVWYELYASIPCHTQDIQAMIEENLTTQALYTQTCDESRIDHVFNTMKEQNELLTFAREIPKIAGKYDAGICSDFLVKAEETLIEKYNSYPRDTALIVSLTSFPGRIGLVHHTIKSLLEQYMKPDRIILWLAKPQFKRHKGLPKELLALRGDRFEIRWCNDDLKPHKKYYYTMLENPDAVVITVDDDVAYEKSMVSSLYESYMKFPHAISCLRGHKITFNKNNNVALYKNWAKEDNSVFGSPSFDFIPTGVGGVLYPPHSLHKEVFNKKAILELCLNADDIWLKIMSVANGYPAVLAAKNSAINLVEGTQNNDECLYRKNVFLNENDHVMKKLINVYNNFFDEPSIEDRIREDGCGGSKP